MFLRSPITTRAKLAIYGFIGRNPWAAKILDRYLARRMYRRVFGRYPDLARPALFNEKITARKLFDQRAIFPLLADKLKMRGFIAGRLGERYLPALLGVQTRFDDIDFDSLPDKFVIKPNHGSHWVMVIEDKKALDRAAARRRVQGWLRTNYYVNSREVFYKDVKPQIMIEEYLEEDSATPASDYKCYVFDGVLRFFSIGWRPAIAVQKQVVFFDRAGREMPVRVAYPDAVFKRPFIGEPGHDPTSLPPMPANLDRLIETAERIGKGFDFIRADLYSPGGRILVGELTSLPNGGIRAFDPPEYDRIFGNYWQQVLGGASP